jgi:hypothetical protein
MSIPWNGDLRHTSGLHHHHHVGYTKLTVASSLCCQAKLGVDGNIMCLCFLCFRHNASEESTDGIDLSSSCSFNLANRSSWKLAVKGDNTAREEKLHDKLDLGVLGEFTTTKTSSLSLDSPKVWRKTRNIIDITENRHRMSSSVALL